MGLQSICDMEKASDWSRHEDALLMHGGTDNWSPERWKGRFDEVCGDRRVLLLPDAGVRSRRGPLRRGVEARARRTRRVSQICASIFNLGAGVDALMADQHAARRAAGAGRGRRPHRTDDRICRAARADASPAGALFAGLAARQALGAEDAMAGERDLGRHHGPRHARRACRRRAPAIGFRVSGWSRSPKRSTASNAFTARRSSMRSCARPISWSACCR